MTVSASPSTRIGWPAVASLAFLAAAFGALESMLSPTLPLLQRELNITPAQGALLSIALLLTGALAAPIAGVFGDRYGGKRVLLLLAVMVCTGGTVSSLAPNLPVLLLGQVLQGGIIGAIPLSFIVLRKFLPADQNKVALGVVSGLFIAGGMAGLLAAGPIAENMSWHWMFAIPTIVIAIAALLVAALLPTDEAGKRDAGFDWAGLALLAGLLVTLMLLLSMAPELGSQPLVLLALVAVLAAFVLGWVAVERRVAAPMVDLQMLAVPEIWRSYLGTFVVSLGAAASIFLIPQLFAVSGDGYGFGASSTQIGWYLLPSTITAAAAGPLAGLGVRRYGANPVIVVGVAAMTVSLFAMGLFHDEIWQLVFFKALVGLANGLAITAMLINCASIVEHSSTGTATSFALVIRVVGGATGAQLGGAFLTASTPAGSDVPAESAFVTSFVIAGGVSLLALLAIRTRNRKPAVQK